MSKTHENENIPVWDTENKLCIRNNGINKYKYKIHM